MGRPHPTVDHKVLVVGYHHRGYMVQMEDILLLHYLADNKVPDREADRSGYS
jgi:hypothetical protein